jgi:two-component system, response regulator
MRENATAILLVEDNPDDVELTLAEFKRHNLSNKIHVVPDGATALEYIFGTGAYVERDCAKGPKVILLDLKLPKVDGLEVLRQIKADSAACRIPVVVLTSSTEERDLIKSHNLGANSYIVKPVDFEQFTESMRQIGLYWLLLDDPPVLQG